jgi:cyclin-dependent kinase 2
MIFNSGTPDETVWPNVTQLPDFKSSFPKWPIQSVANVLPHLCPEGIDLITVSKEL